jgi:6,7-dimethyl-8-ribityllumazine synthase
MGAIYKGELLATGRSFAIIISRFNEFITKQLLDGCLDALKRHGADEKDIEITWVPGAFEIPLILKKVIEKKKQDAVICLGAIIRGDTAHFEYIAHQTTRGIAELSNQYGVPVSMGIIIAETIEEAIERAGTKMGNKGAEAALTAIELSNLIKKL